MKALSKLMVYKYHRGFLLFLHSLCEQNKHPGLSMFELINEQNIILLEVAD